MSATRYNSSLLNSYLLQLRVGILRLAIPLDPHYLMDARGADSAWLNPRVRRDASVNRSSSCDSISKDNNQSFRYIWVCGPKPASEASDHGENCRSGRIGRTSVLQLYVAL